MTQKTPALLALSESGLSGFSVTVWHGLYAPKNTPLALRAALKDPGLVKRQEALGVTMITDSRVKPEAHKRFVDAEMNRWSTVIRASGQYAD